MEQARQQQKPVQCISTSDIDALCDEVMQMSRATETSEAQTIAVDKQHRSSMQFFGAVCPPPLKYCIGLELFESPLHGRGVRTQRAIPPDSCVTHFPCHAIGDRYDLYITDETRCSHRFKTDLILYAETHGFTIPMLEAPEPKEGEAPVVVAVPPSFEQMIVNDAWRCIGDPYAEPVSQLLLGHMLNDARGNVFAACPDDVAQLHNRDFRNIVMAYLINGKRANNCRFSVNKSRTCVTVVSTRLITPGEELLVPYGAYYWFLARYKRHYTGGDALQHLYSEGKRLFDALYSDEDFIKWREQCTLIEKGI